MKDQNRILSDHSNSAGFTLLELIVAFTIMALVAAMAFAGLRVALNSYAASQTRLEEAARERVLIDHMKRQIGSLYPLTPSAAFASDSQEEMEPVDLEAQMLAAQSPLFYGDADSVTFITVAPLVLTENPGLTVVRYGLAQNEFGDFYLGAMEARYTGRGVFLTMADLPRGKPLPLVENVQDLQFQYYGYDWASESYQWFDYWNGEEMSVVPEAIRITYDEDYAIVPINANFAGGVGNLGALGPGIGRVISGTVGAP
jgi:prepilin-type N-terminal cleavage/methylation domain-containing protein